MRRVINEVNKLTSLPKLLTLIGNEPMCGIAGTVGISNPDLVARMTRLMAYRGPDDEGILEQDPICFGHRRLSIIDLTSAGHQPMVSSDGRLVITYNGEIYNFRELRRELEAKGRRFHSATDTEVILQAYSEYGIDCLSRLEGMFAFAIWDELERRLVLSRDRLGIKPLFYHLNGDEIAFASELKPLCLIPGLVRRVNERALRSVMRLTCNIEQESILRSIFKLPAGQYLTWCNGESQLHRYWNFPTIRPSNSGLEHTSKTLRTRLTEAVRSHLVSDVPVGTALSGGLDSSGLVAVMVHLGESVKTFTAGHGADDPDLINARYVADHFRTDHHETMLDAADLPNLLPRVVWHLDEPMGLGSPVQMYLNYERAAEHIKVLLIGEGADELFAGYTQYKIFDRMLPLSRSLRQDLYQRTYMLADEPARSLTGRLATSLLMGKVPPNPLKAPYPRAAAPEFSNHEQHMLARALHYDQQNIMNHRLLRQADAIGMSRSLELRVPYLDRRLVEFAATIPEQFMLRRLTGKYILRKALEPLLPSKIRQRFKRPYQIRFNTEVVEALHQIANKLLTPDAIQQRGWFDHHTIKTLLENGPGRISAPKAKRFWNYRIWTLISIEIWARLFIDCNSIEVAPTTLSDIL